MQSRLHRACNAVRRQQRPQRQPGGERLRDRQHVRLDPVLLIRKIVSGTPKPALNLIQQKQRAGFLSQLASGSQDLRADWIDAAVALDGLDTHSAYAAIKLPFQISHIVKGGEIYS